MSDAIIESTLAYKALRPEEKALICNGCGAANAKFDFVPDRIYGLPIGPACEVHDFDYHVGTKEADRLTADLRLLANVLRLINAKGGWLRWLRRRRAYKYYEAVREGGGRAFWAGKD